MRYSIKPVCMMKVYNPNASHLKLRSPRKETVDFLLLYSKSTSHLRLKKTKIDFLIYLN